MTVMDGTENAVPLESKLSNIHVLSTYIATTRDFECNDYKLLVIKNIESILLYHKC